MTVKQLKEFANDKGFKVKATKKADIIAFIEGKLQEAKMGVVKSDMIINQSLEKLVPVHYDFEQQPWIDHMFKHGWCVVKLDMDAAQYRDSFFSWLESCCSDFKRDDKTTWMAKNLPSNLHGIYKQYIGHEPWVWAIREKCIPIFTELWGTDDLLCSFDGGCFLPPSKRNNFKQWIHCDQGQFSLDFCSVQGVINLNENSDDDGGLVLVEGSHEVFEAYFKNHPSDGITWFTVDMDDPTVKDLRLIKICAPAGHAILWDSRVFHCNVAPTSGNFRMCTYVSMQPRANCDEKTLKKRIKAYEDGRMTGHWCYGPWFNVTAKDPRTYGKEINKPRGDVIIAPLNERQRRLVGY
jgi:hypothetical protein